MKTPTPAMILRARRAAEMTQQAAAEAVHRNRSSRWHEWETGQREMPLAEWELFLYKTYQHKDWKDA